MLGHICGMELPSRATAHASCSTRGATPLSRQLQTGRIALTRVAACHVGRRHDLWTPGQADELPVQQQPHSVQPARTGSAACRASRQSELWTPTQDEEGFEEFEDAPSAYRGLSPDQIELMGLQSGLARLGQQPDPASLSASNYYAGFQPLDQTGNTIKNSALETRMAMRGSAYGRRSKPPDLASKLLDARIVYVGMPFTPKVTELVLAELFFLSIDRANQPINVYVHSFGTQTPNKQAISFETDAYAIIDTFRWIEPKVYTLVIGEAFGNAALIVAAGEKGRRVVSPNARMMTCPPRMNRSYGTTKSMMIRANDLESNMTTYSRYMAAFTGRPYDQVRKDMSRNRYFTAQQAVDYGLVDRILAPDDRQTLELQAAEQKQRTKILEQQTAVQQARQKERELVGAGAGGDGPDTGY